MDGSTRDASVKGIVQHHVQMFENLVHMSGFTPPCPVEDQDEMSAKLVPLCRSAEGKRKLLQDPNQRGAQVREGSFLHRTDNVSTGTWPAASPALAGTRCSPDSLAVTEHATAFQLPIVHQSSPQLSAFWLSSFWSSSNLYSCCNTKLPFLPMPASLWT